MTKGSIVGLLALLLNFGSSVSAGDAPQYGAGEFERIVNRLKNLSETSGISVGSYNTVPCIRCAPHSIPTLQFSFTFEGTGLWGGGLKPGTGYLSPTPEIHLK